MRFNRNIIVILVLVVLVGGLWYMFTSTPQEASLTTSDTSTDTTGGATDSIVQTLLALKTITLSGTVFTDPAFQSLKDFTTQIVSEPVGRTDPFAGLAPETQATPQTTQTAQIFKK